MAFNLTKYEDQTANNRVNKLIKINRVAYQPFMFFSSANVYLMCCSNIISRLRTFNIFLEEIQFLISSLSSACSFFSIYISCKKTT